MEGRRRRRRRGGGEEGEEVADKKGKGKGSVVVIRGEGKSSGRLFRFRLRFSQLTGGFGRLHLLSYSYQFCLIQRRAKGSFKADRCDRSYRFEKVKSDCWL